MDIKNFIQELNMLFKKKEWKLLSEDNSPPAHYWNSVWVYEGEKAVVLDREFFSYYLYEGNYPKPELDKYIVEYIKPICKKYKINTVIFTTNGDDVKNKIKIL